MPREDGVARLGSRRRTGEVDHPWPQPLPAGWDGHFLRPQPLPYVQTQPVLVVEVRVDAALADNRSWRHGARYQRPRPALSIYEVPLQTAWEE